MKNLIACLSLAVCCLLATIAFSQTTFTGAVSNDWNDDGNWDNGHPYSGNDAIIPFGSHVYSYEGFCVCGFELYNDGVIFVDSYGTGFGLENDETIHNGGLIFVHGDFSSSGTINNNNGGTIIVDWQLYNDGTINNNHGGTINISDGMVSSLSNDGTINNYGFIWNHGQFYDLGGIVNHCGLYMAGGHLPYDTVSCSVLGCTDSTACNYDSDAEIDDGSCEFISCLDDCGVLNGDNSSCSGCTYADATNYDSTVTIDDGTCVFPDITSDNQDAYDAGVASVDITSDNQDAYDAGVASVDITSDNQDAFDAGVASVDITSDNQAVYDGAFADGVDSVECPENPCPADYDFNSVIDTADLLTFLTYFGTNCE